MLDPLAIAAISASKLIMRASRLASKGGSSLPGLVSRKIYPGLLKKLAGQPELGTVLITGTNGKTTTSSLLARISRTAGLMPVHNRAGANLISGITAAYVESSSIWGTVRANVGLIETDEATVPVVSSEVPVTAIIVTNFFRDQLDRYGELERTIQLIIQGLEIQPGAVAVLNADDPYVVHLGRAVANRRVYYGLDVDPFDRNEPGWGFHHTEVRRCMNCGGDYDYAKVYYDHLGSYKCPCCGMRRPDPEIYVDMLQDLGMKGTVIHLVTPEWKGWVNLKLPGLFNVYNAVAAAAGAYVLGINPRHVVEGLEQFTGAFGRMELVNAGGRQLCIALVKNPAGFNQVINTMVQDAHQLNLLIAVNDLFADGRDVSWLWDVDFEILASHASRLAFVVNSGLRAEDVALRLKYAGLPKESILIEKNLKQGLRTALSLTPEGKTLFVLPTYTAMLGIREEVSRMCNLGRFWEELHNG